MIEKTTTGNKHRSMRDTTFVVDKWVQDAIGQPKNSGVQSTQLANFMDQRLNKRQKPGEVVLGSLMTQNSQGSHGYQSQGVVPERITGGVKDTLPNVSRHSQNKSMVQRLTMYNNSYFSKQTSNKPIAQGGIPQQSQIPTYSKQG